MSTSGEDFEADVDQLFDVSGTNEEEDEDNEEEEEEEE